MRPSPPAVAIFGCVLALLGATVTAYGTTRMEREIYREVLYFAEGADPGARESARTETGVRAEAFDPARVHLSPARAVLLAGRSLGRALGASADLIPMRLAVCVLVASAFALAFRSLAAPFGEGGVALALGGVLLSPALWAWWHLAAIEPVLLALLLVGLVLSARAACAGGAHAATIAGVVLGLALGTKVSALAVLAGVHFHLARPLRKRLWLGVLLGYLLEWPRVLFDPTLPLRHIDQWSGPMPPTYFGGTYGEIPWHYAPVLLILRTPILVLVFGVAGLLRNEPFFRLLGKVFLAAIAAAVLFHGYLEVGMRHLLPLVLVLHLAAGCDLARRLPRWPPATRGLVAAAFLIPLLLANVRLAPAGLSYYSEAIGGLRGARAMGLEVAWAGEAFPRIPADLFQLGPKGITNFPYKRWPAPDGIAQDGAEGGPKLLLLSGPGELPEGARPLLVREGVPLVAILE